jgi:hypothetical protein
LSCVVIAGTGPDRIPGWKLIPLLTGYFTGFAANAKAGIGEEAHSGLRRRRWLFVQHRL